MTSDTSIQHTRLPWSFVTDPDKMGAGWEICHGGDWVMESVGLKSDQMGDSIADGKYIHMAAHAYPQLTAVLFAWYRTFRPVMQPGTEGEALLERTAAALGIDFDTGRPL